MPEKSNVSLLWMGPGCDKLGAEWPARAVANFIFGGDFSSRLNERLRVKDGLTYGSFSWFSNSRSAGPFCISAQVNPENVEPAIKATQDELKRYAAEGPTVDEVKLAQDYLTGNFPVRLAANSDVASALTDAVYLGRGVDYISQYPALIRAVTPDQVAAAARQYLEPGKLMLVVAGTVP